MEIGVALVQEFTTARIGRHLGASRHDQSLEDIKPELKVGISTLHSSCNCAVGSNSSSIIAILLDCKRNRCIAIDIAQRRDVSR